MIHPGSRRSTFFFHYDIFLKVEFWCQESLSSKDTVLVVDDFLATGTTGVALHKLIQQAGATAAGMAFLLEKRFQDGRGERFLCRTDWPWGNFG